MQRPPADVTVVIPIWNSGRWLESCLACVARQSYPRYSVLVVDDGSTDGSAESVGDHPTDIEVVRLTTNRGFAAAVNEGIKRSQGRYVALLNVDTEPRREWLARLVERLEASPARVGAVASKMLQMEAPELLEDAGNSFSWYASATKRGYGMPHTSYSEATEVFSVCAGAALFRRDFLRDVGGFDESFESYLEDVDLCLRGRLLGYTYLFEPAAEVLHFGHGSGIGRSRYVTLMTRNRLLTLAKSVPARLLLRHAATLLYGQLYFFLVYRKPLSSLAGYAGALRRIPSTLLTRRELAHRRVLSVEQIDEALNRELGEPSLRHLIRRRLGSAADQTGGR